MINLKLIILAMLVFFTALDLFIPNEAYAFGKKIEQIATTSNSPTPVVMKPQVKVEAKPVAFRPAQPVQPVIKTVAAPKIVAPKKVIAKKQPKIKAEPVTFEQATKALKSTEQAVTVSSETSQPTAGQRISKHVDNGVDSVSGFFGKLKGSMNQPATQNSCSTAQKAMSQC